MTVEEADADAPPKRHLVIGLSLTATWLKGRSRAGDITANPVSFDVGLSQMAERAGLDFVFKPDTLSVPPAAQARGMAQLDPTIALTAVALQTERIGLVTTVSTSFNPPFVTARQLQSLHWVSNGRAGWNIVTSIEGAENFGQQGMPDPATRYRKAVEFTETVRRLWRSHPAPGSADGAELQPVGHAGEFFQVRGPLNIPEHPAGEIPLFQAGASDEGRGFAASVADAIFAATPDMAAARELRADLRRRAVDASRAPDAVRVLPGLYFFIARTREEAWALHRRAHEHLSRETRLDKVRAILGADLSAMRDDETVVPAMLPDGDQPVRSRTHADLLRRYIAQNQPSLRVLLARPEVVGSAHWVSVGTVDDVLADIIRWFDAEAIDGFIALPGGSTESMRLFFDELMPKLATRKLFRAAYDSTTLRGHLGIV
ncbi:NtaA/DmoA family FMN-dependent monooxygenase [Paracoccus onubensis]|uniref:NtaA/DmoA family FMN-dependent monooxygenase n=1 Tax=Paracoccus onubensis TaxID=1675788 RepID=UPI001E60D885|nr:NtaA/DmoA family FMN-dependent monooxygenase [Paracoccus onubensis]